MDTKIQDANFDGKTAQTFCSNALSSSVAKVGITATRTREIGVLVPGDYLDTLRKEALSPKNLSVRTFDALRRINGRPLFAWIAQSFLKSSECASAKLYVLCEPVDEDLITFVRSHYPRQLIETIRAESIEKGLTDILEKEAELASSLTLIRENSLVLDNISRQSDFQLVVDGRIILFHIQNLKHFIELLGINSKITFQLSNLNSKCNVREITKSEAFFFDEENWIEAKTKLIESRSFNSLKIDPLFPEILKTSKDKQKLKNEVFWYRELPNQFKSLAPQIFNYDDSGIRMEFYGYGTLTEKFLYDDLKNFDWEFILSRLFRIVQLFSHHRFKYDQQVFRIFYLNKLENRCERASRIPEINRLFAMSRLVINGVCYRGMSSLLPVIYKKFQQIAESAQGTLCHGDLCFNNILFDRKSGIIKLIDPRGNIEGIPSIMCDPRYDIAKLKHSFCGNYDGIVEGEFFINEVADGEFTFIVSQENSLVERETLFAKLCKDFDFDIDTINLIEAYLFLTMIPLHTDSIRKMEAFFLTSLIKFNKCFGF